jgi:hypothetical protein
VTFVARTIRRDRVRDRPTDVEIHPVSLITSLALHAAVLGALVTVLAQTPQGGPLSMFVADSFVESTASDAGPQSPAVRPEPPSPDRGGARTSGEHAASSRAPSPSIAPPLTSRAQVPGEPARSPDSGSSGSSSTRTAEVASPGLHEVPTHAAAVTSAPSVHVNVPTIPPAERDEIDISAERSAPSLVTVKDLRTSSSSKASDQPGQGPAAPASRDPQSLPPKASTLIAVTAAKTAPPLAAEASPDLTGGVLEAVRPSQLARTPSIPLSPSAPAAEPPADDRPAVPPSTSTVEHARPDTRPSPPPRPQAGARAVEGTPRRAVPPVSAPASTDAKPIALRSSAGAGGLSVRLDGPRFRVTDQPTAIVSGRIVSGAAPNVVLHVNDVTSGLTVEGRTFSSPVTLKPGVNVVRLTATDSDGRQSEDLVTIEYRPPPRNVTVVLTSPADGHTLTAADLPVVVMEGEVDDPRVTRVGLVANGNRLIVPVVERRFRQVVPVLEPVVRLHAEIVDGADGRGVSPTITVNGPGAPSAGVLVINWTSMSAGPRPDVVAMFRARADRVDVSERLVTVEPLTSRPGSPPDVFVIRKMQAGVYRFVMRYAGLSSASGVPVLYVGRAGTPAAHLLAPLSLAGTGQAIVTRVLLPYAVTWEQDEWFTGKSESSDTITKFRIPEGVTWTEQKSAGR